MGTTFLKQMYWWSCWRPPTSNVNAPCGTYWGNEPLP